LSAPKQAGKRAKTPERAATKRFPRGLRATIRERTRAAMQVKRGRGERISGHAPYGWDFGPYGLLIENLLEQELGAWIQVLPKKGMRRDGMDSERHEAKWTMQENSTHPRIPLFFFR